MKTNHSQESAIKGFAKQFEEGVAMNTQRYKVEDGQGSGRRFTNRKKADRYAREQSRKISGLQYLCVLEDDCPDVYPQGRWTVADRYSNGAITLYR